MDFLSVEAFLGASGDKGSRSTDSFEAGRLRAALAALRLPRFLRLFMTAKAAMEVE